MVDKRKRCGDCKKERNPVNKSFKGDFSYFNLKGIEIKVCASCNTKRFNKDFFGDKPTGFSERVVCRCGKIGCEDCERE